MILLKPIIIKGKKNFPALFFVVGFLVDIFLLGRIDQGSTLFQHFLFLVVAGTLLSLEASSNMNFERGFFASRGFQKIWSKQKAITHFLLGGLLSSFTLFYFKSASLASSLLFMMILACLFVANESERLRNLELPFRYGMFSLCVCSFLAYVIPILFGTLGLFTFLLSMVLAAALFWGTARILLKTTEKRKVWRNILYPGLGVPAAFFLFYLLKWIPPVPLSLQYIGIYHDLQKENGQYVLKYHRPFWAFWQNGAQTFEAQPGDPIYCFARIFSPTGFRDRIWVHWERKNEKQGRWDSWDRIPMTILGGRDRGFRGYVYKKNWEPGDWRVLIKTDDDRELGRISLSVATSDETVSEFKKEIF